MATDTPASDTTRKWFSWPRFFWAAAVILGTCALQSWVLFNHWQMVGADGDPRRYFGIAAFQALALLALFVIGLPAGIVLVFFRHSRLIGLALLVGIPANVFALYHFAETGMDYRMEAFRALGERSMPLIEAINAYESHHGRPPENLDALVPEFIEAIPGTGMGAYPKFELLTGEDAKRYPDNPWVVSVFTPLGGVNFDQFMYFPNQQYLKERGGNGYERLGEWAYYHE